MHKTLKSTLGVLRQPHMAGKFAILASLAAVLYLGPSAPAHAKGCAGQWDYSVASLQEARRRVKSAAHKSVPSRVACGIDITDALALAEMPLQCDDCRQEYINLLRDLIQYARWAAEHAAGQKNKLEFYKQEIQFRMQLGQFLVDSESPDLLNRYWSKNFEGMGDAMDRSGLGKEFHEEAVRSRGRLLSEKSFETWARAIRSCQAWDFRQGENQDIPGLRKSLLCADECRRALVKIRSRAEAGEGVDKDEMKAILDDLLPALDSCPGGGP